jgi:uncharacterized membrane protein
MKKISQLKDQAVTALEGNWLKSALVTLIYLAIMETLSVGTNYGISNGTITNHALSIKILGFSSVGALLLLPIHYGYLLFCLNIKRGIKGKVSTLLEGFNDYGRIWCTTALQYLYTILWMFLLLIPGIIKGYSYSLTLFILKDYPELKNNGAINLSMRMMKGHKMKMFLMDLSFLGWLLLCFLTLGIGLLFLVPYMETTRAAFYENLKEELGMKSAETAAAAPENTPTE